MDPNLAAASMADAVFACSKAVVLRNMRKGTLSVLNVQN
jgi:hypothetical protein